MSQQQLTFNETDCEIRAKAHSGKFDKLYPSQGIGQAFCIVFHFIVKAGKSTIISEEGFVVHTGHMPPNTYISSLFLIVYRISLYI
jgi:hypothetical protein